MTACRYDPTLGYRVLARSDDEPCTQRHCCVEGCGDHVLARGWCNKHYHRWRRTGDPIPPPQPSLEERIRERMEIRDTGYATACWLSTRPVGTNGYTHISVGRKRRLLHRVAYELWVGPIPDGLTIDHLCRVKVCCNPEHLEPVTQRVNQLRSDSPAARRAKQTHCLRGHEFTPENTEIKRNGCRGCKACHRQRDAERKGAAA